MDYASNAFLIGKGLKTVFPSAADVVYDGGLGGG